MAEFERTLERLVPKTLSPDDATGAATLDLHLQRYRFALGLAGAPRRILDIACGVGYGSALLADGAPDAQVTAVDLSELAIRYARENYTRPNLTFVCADAMTFADTTPFDMIVSLETIEHLPDPVRFVRRLGTTLLASRGVFFGSVPVTPSMDANPHHLTDFTEGAFRRLVQSAGLTEFDALRQVQSYNPLAVAARTEARMGDMRKGLLGYYARHPGKAWLRLHSALMDGFNNKYLTLAARKA